MVTAGSCKHGRCCYLFYWAWGGKRERAVIYVLGWNVKLEPQQEAQVRVGVAAASCRNGLAQSVWFGLVWFFQPAVCGGPLHSAFILHVVHVLCVFSCEIWTPGRQLPDGIKLWWAIIHRGNLVDQFSICMWSAVRWLPPPPCLRPHFQFRIYPISLFHSLPLSLYFPLLCIPLPLSLSLSLRAWWGLWCGSLPPPLCRFSIFILTVCGMGRE